MNKYFTITGIVSILLLAFILSRFGLPENFEYGLFALLYILTIAAYLIYPKYGPFLDKKLRTVCTVLLFVMSIIFNVTALALAVFMVANYPEEKPFVVKLAFPSDSENGLSGFLEIKTLADEFYENNGEEMQNLSVEIKDFNFENDDILELLESTREGRELILKTLAEKPLSQPIEILNDPGKETFHYFVIRELVNLELTEIARLINNDKHSLAQSRYLRLWKISSNLLTGKSETLQYNVAFSLIDSLSKFLLRYPRATAPVNGKELLDVTLKVDSELDSSCENIFVYEYVFLENLFKALKGVNTFDFTGPLYAEALNYMNYWPFFDYYKTLRMFHDAFSNLAGFCKKPYYSIENSLNDYVTRAQAEFDNMPRLVNPVGNIITAIALPYLEKFIINKERTKSNLNIVIYAIRSLRDNNFADAPIDNLTGRPYLVTERSGSVEIKSEFKREDGESIECYCKQGRI